jgi:sugar phosphate isomerase/epimerase
MPRLAVSSWSLRHTLGPVYPGLALTPGEREPDQQFGRGSLSLLDLPAAARAADIGELDLCHFHFPRTDDAYLRELRGRLDAAEARVLTLLVDEGDISAADPVDRERDLADMRAWIDVAAKLTARYVRVIAGQRPAAPGDGAPQRSAAGLAALARYAAARPVGLLTENWRPLAMSPDVLLAILDAAGGAVGLCADFGNYKGTGKYDALRAILPRATTIHAHAAAAWLRPGTTDEGDLRRCLDLARETGFAGPYVLILESDGPDDEWSGIARLATIVRA